MGIASLRPSWSHSGGRRASKSLVRTSKPSKETGELLWVAGRTRPDISLAVNTMCQWATKRPRGVAAIGKQVRAYLRETRDEGLFIQGLKEGETIRGRLMAVDVFSDASYASSDLKSLSGIVVDGTPIMWQTSRQVFITLSTAGGGADVFT